MVHFDSDVCVLLVWLLVWNDHRHIAHSPLPVADNYRPITMCFTVRRLHYCVSFHPSRPHELLPCGPRLRPPPLPSWATTPYAPAPALARACAASLYIS